MGLLAIIGGSGSGHLVALRDAAPQTPAKELPETPYGFASAPIRRLRIAGREVLFLPRHGVEHGIPPHRVNYRANLWALKDSGADRVVALAAAGGIAPDLGPGRFAVPHQVIDYTHGRDQSFHEGGASGVVHVDFTEPYCGELRAQLLAACADAGVPAAALDVYGATQGPRLETAAEITRMERDGCDLVGMTGMPEAALARELDLCYATLAFVVNWAAGKGQGPIRMDEVEGHLSDCMGGVEVILAALVGPRAAAH
jgi:5'-methylthioadenosine phosphorylase/5'-methylthioinosine phosphorylase